MPLSDPLGIENQDPLGIEKPSTPTLDISQIGKDPYDIYKLQESKSQNLEDYSQSVPPSLNPNYDFVRSTGYAGPIGATLGLAADAVGKGLVKIADIPTRISNIGKTPESPGYRETLEEREARGPIIKLPRVDASNLSGVPAAIAGAENAVLGAGESIIGRPSSAFTLPLLGAEGGISRMAGGIYGLNAAAQLPSEIQKAVEVYNDPNATTAQKSEAIANPVVQGALAYGMLKHAGGPREAAPTAEVQGPYSLGRMLRTPKGAEPNLQVESVQPLDVQSGTPISPQELIARQSRTPVLPETPEPEVKTWNLDQPEEIQNAPQIRQQSESYQREHPRNGGERPPAETGGGGGAEQRAEAPKPQATPDEPVARVGDARRSLDEEISQIDFAKIQRPHEAGIIQGVKLTEQDVPDIRQKQEEASAEAQQALQRGDSKGFQSAFGKATYFGGVIEGALKKGPNYDLYLQRNEIQSPAIKIGDKIITGENHVAAYEKAKATGTPDTSGAIEGFVTKGGKFLTRSDAAKVSGVPTTVEPGKLHSEDLQKMPQLAGMGAAKYGEVTGPKTPLGELEQQIHILSEQSPVADKQKEAFNLGDKLQTFKDGVSENLQGLKAAGKYLQKKLIGKPEVTDLKRAIGNRHLSLTDSAINARKFVETAEKKIPSKLIQEAISDYVDTGGDKALLEKAANETKRPYYAGYKRAQNLTPDEITVANNIRQYFESRLDDAQKNGILEDGIEDYIHRYYQSDTPWKNGILAELRSGIFTGKPALAKQRVFDYDFEAEKAGLKPIKSFIKRVAAYDLSLNKAIADRNIVKEMTQIKMPDGRPMVDVAGAGIPTGQPVEGEGATLIKPSARANSDKPIDNRSDYRPFDAPALRRWKWVGTDENGNPIMLQGDVLVHPGAIKDVRALFERSRVRANPLGRLALNASSLVKQTMLDLSLFHPVQISVHGLEHRSNVPFGEFDAKFLGREFRPLDDYINDPQVRGLVRGGMVMGETTGRELFYEGLSGSSLTKHIPGVGPKLAQFTDWLFNDYIPRLKAETGLHALERNRQRYPNLSEDQLNHLTANQMNAAFGEQNYEMIGRSKTTQDMLRLAFLAPDFLESRMKFAGQATTKYGREQFVALMLGAATMYIVARLLNKAINNEYHFEPQNAFSVIRNGKAYSLRTVQGDILMAATDPEKFVRHRLNPVYGRTAMEAITQRDEFGRTRNARQQLQDFAQTIVPISLRGLINPREQNLLESTLNAVGVTEHRASPTTLVYNLANQYKKEHKIAQEPGEFIYDPDKDPYRPIRQAAIFSTPETVAAEIERAVKEGKKPEDILKHFQRYANAPFVGSKKKEAQFFQSLDADNQKIYRDAKLEKKKVLENVNMGIALWRRSKFNPQ